MRTVDSNDRANEFVMITTIENSAAVAACMNSPSMKTVTNTMEPLCSIMMQCHQLVPLVHKPKNRSEPGRIQQILLLSDVVDTC